MLRFIGPTCSTHHIWTCHCPPTTRTFQQSTGAVSELCNLSSKRWPDKPLKLWHHHFNTRSSPWTTWIGTIKKKIIDSTKQLKTTSWASSFASNVYLHYHLQYPQEVPLLPQVFTLENNTFVHKKNHDIRQPTPDNSEDGFFLIVSMHDLQVSHRWQGSLVQHTLHTTSEHDMLRNTMNLSATWRSSTRTLQPFNYKIDNVHVH